MEIERKVDIFCPSRPEIKELLKPCIIINQTLPTLKIPDNFKKRELYLPEKDYGSLLREFVEPYAQNAEVKGFGLSVFTAIYEAILNAHQHANKLSEKKILIGSLVTKKSLEIIVCDSCEKLPEHFVSFILTMRLRNVSVEGVIDWYAYSGNVKPETNHGTGTSFMHTYMDTIKYFKSEDTGGLAVYMQKRRKR